MRKNILLFGHSYGPQFIDINNQYTQLFDKTRYTTTVIYLDGEPSEQIRQKHNADEVIFLNAANKVKRGLKIGMIKQLLQLTREKKFEIVICHRYKPTYIMLWVALFHKIPALFFVMHELGTQKHFSRKFLISLLAKNNMIFAGVSNAVRDDMRNDIWRVPTERVITLYNMIDVDFTEKHLLDRNASRIALNLPMQTFLFGNIGRLVKNKDQKTLIEAFALLKQQHPNINAKLIIVGSGLLEIDLKNLASALNVANDVIFTGFVNNGFSYMKAFDAYISSSTQEAFGRVLLEAMIAKVPVIATQVNGVPEVIGNAGSLIPAKDPKKLAAEMLKIYQLPQEMRDYWGLKGYQRATGDFSQKKFHEIFWQLPLIQSLSKEN